MEFYEKHKNQRQQYEVLAIHLRGSVETLAALDEKMKPLIAGVWKGGTPLFPLLVGNSKTEEDFGIVSYPTQLLVSPEGVLVKVKGDVLELLEQKLK